MVGKISESAYRAASKVASLLLPARRKLRGSSAEAPREDPRRIRGRPLQKIRDEKFVVKRITNSSQLARPSLTSQRGPNQDEQSAEDPWRTPRRMRVSKVALCGRGPISFVRREIGLRPCVFHAGFAEVRLFGFWYLSASVC